MFNHAPPNYKCPICLGVAGIENGDTLLKQSDLVYKDEATSVFINSFFIGKNEGHLIVVPNLHYEHVYDIPPTILHNVMDTAKKMTEIMKKVYECEGVTLLQNNEPAGGQHAFHFHLHIFPRYANDKIYDHMTNKRLCPPEERKKYADKIKGCLSSIKPQ